MLAAIDTFASAYSDFTGFPVIDWGSNLLVFFVDVNGLKGHNKFGYDVFLFGVYPNKGIIPAGRANNSKKCVKSTTGDTAGFDCTAKVLIEKKINY